MMRFSMAALVVAMMGISVAGAYGQAVEGGPAATKGTVAAVTVYRGQALVTRVVDLPVAAGLSEVVVSELPERLQPGSLFAESAEGVEVRSVSYRERAVEKDVRKEVQALDDEIKKIGDQITANIKQQAILSEQRMYLDKLANFIAPTSTVEMTKGVLDSKQLQGLTDYQFTQRKDISAQELALQMTNRDLREQQALKLRARGEITGTSSKLLREAVVLINQEKGGGKLRLKYLVDGANWMPSYNIRADAERKTATVEYQASIQQMSGEDWTGVKMTLSTASPSLVAAAPSLNPLTIALAARAAGPDVADVDYRTMKQGIVSQKKAAEDQRNSNNYNNNNDNSFARNGNGGLFNNNNNNNGNFSNSTPPPLVLNNTSGIVTGNTALTLNSSTAGTNLTVNGAGTLTLGNANALSTSGTLQLGGNNTYNGYTGVTKVTAGALSIANAGDEQLNDIAAAEQVLELVAKEGKKDETAKVNAGEGIVVTYDLKNVTSLPSRADRQLIQVKSMALKSEFYKVAVPVLTNYVYDEATLTNSADTVLLAGPVASYVGGQFMGNGEIPTVAVGQHFTVGFGIDASLRATRERTDKTESVQGGNKVVGYTYQITVENFGQAAANVRIMDRKPTAKDTEVKIAFIDAKDHPLSTDEDYQQFDLKKGMLRWDVAVPTQKNRVDAFSLTYKLNMEYDKNLAISAAQVMQMQQLTR